ncbi:hypothetical protein BH20CHL2_BH20CHL2_12520 [soil metagenome]
MQRVFRLVDTAELEPVGMKTTTGFERSVERHGIINPIIVAEVADEDGVIVLEIVDGNRRVRAAKSAGLDKIPAVVLKETVPEDRARLTLMANQLRSYNFHTESLALSALAADEESAGRAANAMGISAVKLQNMQKKLAGMPEEIRRGMYEGTVPVSSATVIAGWPDELQRRIVDELRRKRRLYTRQIDEIKQEYERLHPPPPKPARVAQMPPAPEAPPFDDWYDDEPVAYSGPSSVAAPVSVQPTVSPPPAPQPPSSETAPEAAIAETGVDPREFVKRLDESLLLLARETRARNLSRAAWIDRCMRAWDLSEPE